MRRSIAMMWILRSAQDDKREECYNCFAQDDKYVECCKCFAQDDKCVVCASQ
ncbi:MAG: hypothetical protein IPG99_12375 [Ignavibacteria bacterium]|nr:hypothetical protein [Ignavibacteria bacterium]